MLECENLMVIYSNGVKALDNVNLKFSNTGLYYIIGHSGSGKSTFLNVLLGKIKKYEGSIKLFSKEINKMNEKELDEIRKNKLSISFQNAEMEKELTIYDNLDFILQNNIKKKKERRKIIYKILKELEIFKIRNKTINKISGGEKARVNIARCLIKKSYIYFLDEPLNGLNKKLREKVNLILENYAQRSLVIVITHQKDEICSKSGIINFVDGKAIKIKENQIVEKKRLIIAEKENIKLRYTKKSIRKIIYNKFRTMCTMLTIIVALVTFGIANLLTIGVSKDIEKSLTSNIVKNSISVEKKNCVSLNDEKKNILDSEIEKLYWIYKDNILEKGFYFDINFESNFPNKNKVNLLINDKEVNIPTLDTSLLKNFKLPYEANVSVKDNNMKYDEIYLILNERQYKDIFKNKKIQNVCEDNNIFLYFQFSNIEWNYHFEYLIRVKKIFLGENISLVHCSGNFLKHLLIDEMELLYSDNLESTDKYPWTYKRKSYCLISEDKKEEFLSKLLNDNRFKNYNPYILDETFPCRICFYERTSERIDLEEVIRIGKSKAGLQKYSLTTGMYQYGDEGIYAGFDRPFYVAYGKDKINKLIDKYDISTTPILTSLNMKIDDNIAGGDIYSSSNKNNFLLETISDSEDLKGRIKISSSLAKKLGINLNLSNKIHYAYLAKTIYKKEKYYHIFKTGDLEVAEIITDEKNKIYQNAEFWTIFGITKLLNEEACNISKIILTYDENANINNIKNEFQKNYPNYYFQICGEKIENSIRPIINLIKNVLYFFSGLSCLIATFLLAFSILLVVIEDKNVIMMKNLLGIKKHDIKNEYHALAVFYSLIPGVISFFTAYIMQFSLENILSNVMSNTDYKAGIISSLLTLLLSFFISFSCFPFIDMKITDVLETGNKKYSIKEKINRFLTNR